MLCTGYQRGVFLPAQTQKDFLHSSAAFDTFVGTETTPGCGFCWYTRSRKRWLKLAVELRHTRPAFLCFQQVFVQCKATVIVFEKKTLSVCVRRSLGSDGSDLQGFRKCQNCLIIQGLSVKEDDYAISLPEKARRFEGTGHCNWSIKTISALQNSGRVLWERALDLMRLQLKLSACGGISVHSWI